MAGLTAAYELAKAGHHVAVLEAAARPGGRVHTMRGFASGLHAEAGAAYIGEHHKLTRHYAGELAVRMRPVVVESGTALMHFNHRTVTFGDAANNPGSQPFTLPGPEAGKTTAKMWREATAPVRAVLEREGEKAGWKTIATNYGRITLHEFLEQAGWSDMAITMFALASQREPKLMCPAVDELRDLIGHATSEVLEFSDGADRLPYQMFARLADRVRFGARVVAVVAQNDSVLVVWRGPAGQYTERADYVIVTTPAPVTLGIDFGPGLSREKVKALRAVSYLPATATALQYSLRFWEDSPWDLKAGGTTCTDLPLRRLHYPSHSPEGTVRGILRVQHAWSPETGRWAAMSNSERITQALRDIAQIHPGSDDYFEHGASYSWTDDVFAQGAVALFAPAEQDAQIAAMGAAQGRVMFAGEHTSAWHGTVEGAMESGLRAAGQVHVAAP